MAKPLISPCLDRLRGMVAARAMYEGVAYRGRRLMSRSIDDVYYDVTVAVEEH